LARASHFIGLIAVTTSHADTGGLLLEASADRQPTLSTSLLTVRCAAPKYDTTMFCSTLEPSRNGRATSTESGMGNVATNLGTPRKRSVALPLKQTTRRIFWLAEYGGARRVGWCGTGRRTRARSSGLLRVLRRNSLRVKKRNPRQQSAPETSLQRTWLTQQNLRWRARTLLGRKHKGACKGGGWGASCDFARWFCVGCVQAVEGSVACTPRIRSAGLEWVTCVGWGQGAGRWHESMLVAESKRLCLATNTTQHQNWICLVQLYHNMTWIDWMTHRSRAVCLSSVGQVPSRSCSDKTRNQSLCTGRGLPWTIETASGWEHWHRSAMWSHVPSCTVAPISRARSHAQRTRPPARWPASPRSSGGPAPPTTSPLRLFHPPTHLPRRVRVQVLGL